MGLLLFLAASARAALLPGVEHLSESQWKTINDWLCHATPTESVERAYQRLVQKQVFSDLRKLYDPGARGRVKITYASFTPDLYFHGGSPLESSGDDAGLGLHVIKRLELPLADGGTRTIEVNEHWAQARASGGLFLPDEIRAKIQVAKGERHVVGSEQTYLFDSFRLAWGPDIRSELAILRRSKYEGDEGKEKTMRVPVSAPFSCTQCHRDYAMADYFAAAFLEQGEKRSYEAIVQNGYFSVPLEETLGFRQYVSDLTLRPNVTVDYIDRVKRDLLNPARSMIVPGLYEALGRYRDQVDWIPGDVEWSRHSYSATAQALEQQATYPRDGLIFLDAIEDYFEGKYRWWEPTEVVPSLPYR